MKPRRFAFTLEHTALAFALMLAHAQGAWAGTTTVAITGAAAPGTESGVTFASLSGVRLNAAGQVAFFGGLTGSSVGPANATGLWLDGSLVARTGMVAPGAGGTATLSSLSLMRMNATGQVAYIGRLVGTDVMAANNSALWRDDTLIVRQGGLVPSAGSNVTFSSFSGSFSGLQLNALGQVAYSGSLLNSATGVQTHAILRNTSLVAQSGDTAPGAGSGVTFGGFFTPLKFNDAGQVAYQAALAGSGVNASNNVGLWRDGVMIARTGQAAPSAGTGVTLSSISIASDDSSLQLNAAGQVSYLTGLAGTGVTAANSQAIWRNSTLVARTGQVAPGLGDGAVFSSFSNSLRLSDAGSVAYGASLTGVGVSTSNSFGIWRDNTLIARTGDALPSGAGIGRFSGLHLLGVNLGGQVAFGGNGSDGLFLGDGVEVVQVALTGAALAGSSIFSVRGGDGQAPGTSFNDKGQLVYTATLADGRSGVFLFTPSLHWRSTASGSWADAANWTLSLNPADAHDVIVDAANSLRITGPTAAVTVKSLQVGTGAGLVTLQMAGGSIAAGEPVLIGARGVLSGTGSFSGPVINQGTVKSDRLAMSAGLRNAGLVRGVAGGPQTGAGLDTDLLNQASGRVLVQPGETLQLRGASHRNEGVFEINQGRLEVAGSLLNASGGLIDLNRTTAVADGVWTNATSARLLLSDARLTVSGGLTNAGQVLVTSGDSDVFGRVVNQIGGQILLSGQGSTTFYDAVELQAGSELRTSAGATAVFFGAVAQRSGALLTGTGRKYFEGGLSIGNSPGLGEDAGSVSFGLGSTYLAEIGGLTLGTGYDHYRVAGTLTLGGTLQLVSFAGFTGEAGQQFDLFDWGALQGQFNHIDSSGLQLAAGTTLDVSRLYIDGVISVTAVPEPGSWALMVAGLAGLAGLRRRNAVRKG
jgi:hypothetical protein